MLVWLRMQRNECLGIFPQRWFYPCWFRPAKVIVALPGSVQTELAPSTHPSRDVPFGAGRERWSSGDLALGWRWWSFWDFGVLPKAWGASSSVG